MTSGCPQTAPSREARQAIRSGPAGGRPGASPVRSGFRWYMGQSAGRARAAGGAVPGRGAAWRAAGADERPDLPGANSPYAILTHCLGVMEFWGGHVVAGRAVERDRPAEFRAAGPVADLAERARQAQDQLRSDVALAQPSAPVRGVLSEKDRQKPLGRTQGGALMHVYEELAQHRGQMEITRDILRANGGVTGG